MSPYGSSKLMTEMMLRDAGGAQTSHTWSCAISTSPAPIPKRRTGQSTTGATHLIKVAVQTALGRRPKMEIYGTDYPTPDGTCVRDYIHVSDLVQAHLAALALSAHAAAPRRRSNCGYGRGYSVREVIDAVKHVSGVDFRVDIGGRAARRSGADRRRLRTRARGARLAAAATTTSRRSSPTRSPGSAS